MQDKILKKCGEILQLRISQADEKEEPFAELFRRVKQKFDIKDCDKKYYGSTAYDCFKMYHYATTNTCNSVSQNDHWKQYCRDRLSEAVKYFGKLLDIYNYNYYNDEKKTEAIINYFNSFICAILRKSKWENIDIDFELEYYKIIFGSYENAIKFCLKTLTKEEGK